MARQEQYLTQNKLFYRFEIEGEPLTVSVFQKTDIYRKKPVEVTCVRWVGLHRVKFGDEEFLADRSMACIAPGNAGIAMLVTRHPDIPFTDADRAAGRENINRVLRDMYGCEVNWGAVQ